MSEAIISRPTDDQSARLLPRRRALLRYPGNDIVIRTQVWRDQRERRFHLHASALPELCRILAEGLPIVSYVAGATRTLVATTYLDAIGLDYSTLAVRSAADRSIKVRVREYVALLGDANRPRLLASPTCYLERKERVGQLRIKQRVELDKADLAGILDRQVPLPGDDSVGDLRAEIERRELEPVLVTVYGRRVFGEDGGLRVTVDEGVEFYRPLPELYQGVKALTPSVLGEPIGDMPGCVLEVKEPRDAATPVWIEELLAGLTVADQFSKFRHGVTCLVDASSAMRRARASGD
jgi:hypothetical protein